MKSVFLQRLSRIGIVNERCVYAKFFVALMEQEVAHTSKLLSKVTYFTASCCRMENYLGQVHHEIKS